jgi:acyl-coenzyme A thioesterase 13
MPGTTISPCLRFVRRVTKAFIQAGGHDATCYPSLRINHATPGHVTGEFQIGKHNLNRLGSLHGGLICSLVDTMGSLALASKGLYSTGVSTDIHATFVKAAGGDGDVVKVEGKVINMGESLLVLHDLVDADAPPYL